MQSAVFLFRPFLESDTKMSVDGRSFVGIHYGSRTESIAEVIRWVAEMELRWSNTRGARI